MALPISFYGEVVWEICQIVIELSINSESELSFSVNKSWKRDKKTEKRKKERIEKGREEKIKEKKEETIKGKATSESELSFSMKQKIKKRQGEEKKTEKRKEKRKRSRERRRSSKRKQKKEERLTCGEWKFSLSDKEKRNRDRSQSKGKETNGKRRKANLWIMKIFFVLKLTTKQESWDEKRLNLQNLYEHFLIAKQACHCEINHKSILNPSRKENEKEKIKIKEEKQRKEIKENKARLPLWDKS